MQESVAQYLAKIGSRGGKKSRRVLSSEAAKEMVRIREARRLFKKFHARCFWSFDPNYKIGSKDVPWVVEQLRRNGDRTIWELAEKLCR